MICDSTMNFHERAMELHQESKQAQLLMNALANPYKRATLLNLVHLTQDEEVYDWVNFWFKSYDKIENPEERMGIIDLILTT